MDESSECWPAKYVTVRELRWPLGSVLKIMRQEYSEGSDNKIHSTQDLLETCLSKLDGL